MTNDKDGAALLREAIHNALSSELGDTYDCGRVWDAWHVGTMGEDDFTPVNDRVDEITETVLAALKSHGQAFDAADKTKSTRADIEGLAYDVHHHWSVGHKDEAVAAILRFCPLVDTAGVREACAKVADGNVMSGNDQWSAGHDAAARKIAHAIRSLPLS